MVFFNRFYIINYVFHYKYRQILFYFFFSKSTVMTMYTVVVDSVYFIHNLKYYTRCIFFHTVIRLISLFICDLRLIS